MDDLLNVKIVAASKFSQTMSEAPSVISMVTREQIKDYGWLSMNEILAAQPGFFPSKDYDRRTIGSRGLFEGWNNNHLLMLVDGIPFNDNLYGTAYTWDITPLFFVKSMEIIRGPGSALYGSNATNGVISLNTIGAEDLEKHSMFSVRAGNYGTQVYDMVGGGDNRHFSYVLGFNVSRSAGNEYESYDGSYRFDDVGNFARFTVKDQRSGNYFFGKIDGKRSLKGLSFQVHHQGWDFQTGHGWLWMIPDFDESMQESRLLLSLSYKPEPKGNFSQEYVVRYQRHNIDWNMMLYPNGAFDGFYPSGTWEYLNTKAEDIFGRVQLALKLPKDASILAGVEGTIFFYNGDNEHFSNTDLNDAGGFFYDDGTWIGANEGWWAPFPGNVNRPMGPWFEWVEDKPVKNIGIYGQFASGNMLGEKLKATLGMRFDNQSFNFYAIDKENKPQESKSFSQFSPRLGLVYLVSKGVSIKALAGRAFRAPSPTEMFGANTWTLGSNLRELEPEIITTFELALDWRLHKNLNWRINGFHTKFENQIAYSVQNNNLSTNIYTLTTAGIETEFYFGFGKFNGFVNGALSKRLDEEVIDLTIAEHDDDITWAPAATMNFGIIYKNKKFTASLQGHYQGKVKRRDSDFDELLFVPLRPEEVKSWFSMDARVAYQVSSGLEFSLYATNLFDSENFLAKNFAYPFDYKMMGTRIMAGLTLKL
ncbi:MAG: TonB-dependent receptor [bacterium]|nr:TonB-dependent receptor [bacterium]